MADPLSRAMLGSPLFAGATRVEASDRDAGNPFTFVVRIQEAYSADPDYAKAAFTGQLEQKEGL